jgi:hypothetical protein
MKRPDDYGLNRPWTCPKCAKAFPNGFGKGTHLKWCGKREEHFWSLVDKDDPNGCWLYKGTLSFEGYGYVNIGAGVRRKQWQAHRFAWSLLKGEIPAKGCILHTCDVRNCVNPEHLYLGDRKDNARDKIARRRDPNATLTDDQVRTVKRLLAEGEMYGKDIAKMFGVSEGVISAIRKGKTYNYVQ